jgi:pimeloyl-ACP methyl ester carboxylesterase
MAQIIGAMTTILVPPLLCSSRAYLPVLECVWSYGAASIADTRRDHPLAGWPTRWVPHAPDRFNLLGTSMGGYVALEVIRQAPDRVRALALVSTSARADTAEQLDARRRQLRVVEGGRFTALVDAAFPSVVAARHETAPALLALWRDMAATVGPDVFRRQQKAVMDRVDARALLPSISCPTMILHGGEDRLIPLDRAREMADAIPGAQLVVIERAGHLLFSEQPVAAASAVSGFLACAHLPS